MGGVVLHGGRGSGTTADPFVLVEEITDDGPAILVIRGMRGRLSDAPTAQFQLGFVLRKIVTNCHHSRLACRSSWSCASRWITPAPTATACPSARRPTSAPFAADRFAT